MSKRRTPLPSRAVDVAPDRPATTAAAAARIDRRVRDLGDWRGAVLARVRSLIRRADPGVEERWKWNLPVWWHSGIICTGETYTSIVKLTFAKGAMLEDPAGLFNASLEGKVRRAINLPRGAKIPARAFKALVRAAVALNAAATAGRRSRGRSGAPSRRARKVRGVRSKRELGTGR